jgi:hypothetical protein
MTTAVSPVGPEQVRQHRDQRARREERRSSRTRGAPRGADRVEASPRGRPPRGRLVEVHRREHLRRAASAAASSDMPRARYTRASSLASTSRWGSTPAAPRGRERAAAMSSRCDRTDTYSPAPIDSAPASRPARPVNSTVAGGDPGRADPEHEREVGDEPVVGPEHRRAERARHAAADPRVARPRTTSPWMRSSAAMASVASASAVVGRPRLGALGEGEHEHRAEPSGRASRACRVRTLAATRLRRRASPRRSSQCCSWRPSASASASRIARSCPGAARGEVPVDGGLGPLGGEILAPSTDVGVRSGCSRGSFGSRIRLENRGRRLRPDRCLTEGLVRRA